MLYAVLAVFAALSVVLDQISKYLTVKYIPLHEIVPLWDGVVHLTHLRNTGMAFSMLQGGRWFFLVMTLVVFVLLGLAIRKKWVSHPVSLWALTAIVGGAIGNLIDRVRLGYVVDMIEVEFMNFAVFNVADCFVVCGAILLVIAVFFFEKEEKSHDSAD